MAEFRNMNKYGGVCMDIRIMAESQAAEADEAILNALRESESTTVNELVEITGMGERRVRRSLARLQTAGRVEKDGLYFSLALEDLPSQEDHPPARSPGEVSFTELVNIGRQGFKDGAGIEPKAEIVEQAARDFLSRHNLSWRGSIPADRESLFYRESFRAGQFNLKERERQAREAEKRRIERERQAEEARQQRLVEVVAGALLTGDQKVLACVLQGVPVSEQVAYVNAAAYHLARMKLDARAREIESSSIAELLCTIL